MSTVKEDRIVKADFPHVRFQVDKNSHAGEYTITVVKPRVKQVQIPQVMGISSPSVRQEHSGEDTHLTKEQDVGNNLEKTAEKGSVEFETSSKMSEWNRQGIQKTQKFKGVLTNLKGQVVIARDEEDGLYYEGVVVSCPNPQHASVKRNQDGKNLKLNTRFILPIKGAISTPPLRVGDYVLVRVVNMTNAAESYIPGIVQMPPDVRGSCYYTVLVYNSQTIVTKRRHMVKISKERFDFSVEYICQVLREVYFTYEKSQLSVEPNTEIQVGQGGKEGAMDKRHVKGQSTEQYSSLSTFVDSERSLPCSPTQGYNKNPSPKRSKAGKKSCIQNSLSEHCSDELSVEHHSGMELQSGDEAINDPTHLKTDSDVDSGDYTPSPKDSVSYWCDEATVQPKDRKQREREAQDKLQKQDEKNAEEQQESQCSAEGMNEDLDENTKPSQWGDSVNPGSKTEPCRRAWALLEMRKSLPPVRKEEKVLARWPEEGWYYKGVVKVSCEDFSYTVMKSTGEVQQIWREDIITEKDYASQVISIDDKVIGLHPCYSCYAPGRVIDCASGLTVQVCFYDSQVAELRQDEVYKIPNAKCRHDVQELHKCQTQWLGQAVVARDDNTGIFCIGCVQCKTANEQFYQILWNDGTTSLQNPVHMFGAFTQRHELAVGDRVLAVENDETLDYLPGWIIAKQKGHFTVKFCNGIIKSDILPDESYWLSTDYFEEAVVYYKKKNNF